MENNITVNMENLSEEEREQLMKLIKKSNGSKRKILKPEYNEIYFCISEYGAVRNSIWENDHIDNGCYGIGNCFKTEEEAKFTLEKAKVETELRRFAEENNEYEIDWADKNQEKWCMYYSYMDGDVYFTDAYCHKRNDIYFSSKKIGAQAVNSIGKERLKKYYFEVED
jgi:hypothetical protein|nr:MAG TPA: hypothetical protein [Caudoviricetes sp.]